MPTEGHRPRRSESDKPIIREAAFAAIARPSRVTLPYFKMVGPKRPGAGRRGSIVNEASGAEMAPALDQRLPDAAMGSFGDTMILEEVVIGADMRSIRILPRPSGKG